MGGKRAKLHLPLLTAPRHSHYHLNHCSHHRLNHSPPPHPHPWKNCLPRDQSLLPKSSGTAAVKDRRQTQVWERMCLLSILWGWAAVSAGQVGVGA